MSNPFRNRRNAAFAAVLLAGTALGGVATGWAPAFAEGSPVGGQIQPAAAVVAPAMQGLPGFADLVAKVRPAVVTITAIEKPQQQAEAGSPFPPGSPQDRMFRRYFGAPEGGPQGRGVAEALGSGFLVDAEGHVVTNNHVVKDAASVKVTLDDGRELPARIVGRDERTDLALLKIDAGSNLPFLKLGDSDKARPGDWVVAVGNPFGLGGTVTAGVVSARGRDIGAGPYDDFLQVDAPINRGNSGGPLFAQDGTVIGVNTAIFSPSGGSVGIGFAIPSNIVQTVVSQLEKNGHVERGFLGASTQPVTATMAKALQIPEAQGALVAQVEPDSPASRAGLKAGDVITAVDGATIHSPRELARVIADHHPGSETTLTARRDGEDQKLSVKLASMPAQDGSHAQAGNEEGGQPRFGIGLASIQDAERQGLDLPRGTKGAVVSAVEPDGPAAQAGLQPGDVITSVAGKPVANPEEAVKAIREAARSRGGAVALRVLRDGHGAFVAMQAPQAGKSNQG
ncbi:MAG: endopeptidase [Azospirillum brasilense]|nr:MAG: endopeptidase [Azospirillum brasilense]